ncbi:DUF4402 domain-containing protein [Serratia sp. 1D1416]|uniref:DUF4402 domain-containing protein n=1 Tax=Serratia sp. 1D1416 TaxID=2447890 RepID=UPI001013CA7D|nr:DUF4402 domain-containing protein [Serratia sp. 1D1416]
MPKPKILNLLFVTLSLFTFNAAAAPTVVPHIDSLEIVYANKWSPLNYADVKVSYPDNPGAASIRLDAGGFGFGWYYSDDLRWDPEMSPDSRYNQDFNVILPKPMTFGEATEYARKQGALDTWYYLYLPHWGMPLEEMCICIRNNNHCITRQLCSGGVNPPIIKCDMPATIEITHPTTQAGRDSSENKNINISCTQPGNVIISLSRSTVDLGGGITSSLSMNVGTGGVFSVIKGNNPLTITSNLHVPSGTSPGNYQGSTTLTLEYP